jgi:hypothetical protein
MTDAMAAIITLAYAMMTVATPDGATMAHSTATMAHPGISWLNNS